MQRYKVYPRGFGANSYILTADGKNAVVIDPSSYAVVRELEGRGLIPAYVLLTHCHFDHVGGVSALQESGAKVLCTEQEKPLIGTGKILLMLIGATILVAGIYIAAMNAKCIAVFHIYWILTAILTCIFIYLFTKNKGIYEKMTTGRTPTEKEKEEYRERVKRMKYFLIILLPFLFTVFGDALYIVLLKDLDIFKAVTDLFK